MAVPPLYFPAFMRPPATALAGAMRRASPGVYYYASFAALPVLGLLQTRVLTSLLSQSSYGALQLVTPILSWCVILGGLGVPQYLVRFYSRDGHTLFWKGLSIALLGTGVVALVLVAVALRTDRGVTGVEPGPRFALLLVVAVFVGQLAALVKALLRVQERRLRYNIVVVVERLFVLIGVAAALWVWRGAPIESYLLGSSLGTLAVLLPLGARRIGGLRRVTEMPVGSETRGMLAFGLPIVGVMVLGEMYGSLNRYVIGFAGLGSETVGRYVIGYMIATLGLQALYEPLMTYIHPRVFQAWERKGGEEARRLLGRYLGLYAACGLVMSVLFLVAEPWLIRAVANSSYALEPAVFAGLLLSSYLLGLYRLLATNYLLTKRTGELALSYFVALAINLLAAAALVGRFGLLGVAWASVAGSLVLAVMVWWRGRALVRAALVASVPVVAVEATSAS